MRSDNVDNTLNKLPQYEELLKSYKENQSGGLRWHRQNNCYDTVILQLKDPPITTEL